MKHSRGRTLSGDARGNNYAATAAFHPERNKRRVAVQIFPAVRLAWVGVNEIVASSIAARRPNRC